MVRQSSKHTGNKTSLAQQRLNRIKSEATLSNLLEMNYPSGACQIILTYETGGYIPIGDYARQDITAWIRAARRYAGEGFRYVRTMEQRQKTGKAITVHRIITNLQRSKAEDIAAIWPYGLIRIEEINPGQFTEWAKLASSAGKPGPCRRCWTSSRGLIQSYRNGKVLYGKTEKDNYSRPSC